MYSEQFLHKVSLMFCQLQKFILIGTTSSKIKGRNTNVYVIYDIVAFNQQII